MIVLQIILWILLSLLIVLLVALAAVIFVPVRYKFNANIDSSTKSIVVLRASWLFCMFRYNLCYEDNDMQTKLKFLFFTVKLKSKEKFVKVKKDSPASDEDKNEYPNQKTDSKKMRKNPFKSVI